MPAVHTLHVVPTEPLVRDARATVAGAAVRVATETPSGRRGRGAAEASRSPRETRQATRG